MKRSIIILIAFCLLFSTSCTKSDSTNEDPTNNDSVGAFNQVLYPNNGWKSIMSIHAKNTAATGIQFYGLTECGLSMANDGIVRFILTDTKQSQQDAFTDYYQGFVNPVNESKGLTKFLNYENWKHYYFWPGFQDLLAAWNNTLMGPGITYSVGHVNGSNYQALPQVDEFGNVVTAGVIVGTGTVAFAFLRHTGTAVDSLFTYGSPSEIITGIFPAFMKDGNLYAMMKIGRTVYLKQADNTNYANNQQGTFSTISSIDCPDFIFDNTTEYLARVSPDRRYIYYWIAENYLEPRKAWFFKFDVETQNLSRVYNNIDLAKPSCLDNTGKSLIAAIGDDGSLFFTGPEDPNSTSSKIMMYRVLADGSAAGAQPYKSSNFLQKDAYGNRYQAENLMYLNGKLYFTVRSGLLPYENPQFDIIREE
jgi:hypothetical protein